MKIFYLTVAMVLSPLLAAIAAPVFSAQERSDGLLEGRGMGLATPAENHGYPGPRHALDAADQLGLTGQQKQRTAKLVDAMKAEAIPAAKRLLSDEAALDQLFIDHKATAANIVEASDNAARAESALRVIHLKYHLAMFDVLTPEQVAKYIALKTAAERNAASPVLDMPGMSDHAHMHGE